jgi:hypothetical protein
MTMMRYVAMILRDGAQWIILLPDFPDISVLGFPLRAALETARQQVVDRAAILRMLGVPMPPPMRVADLISAAGYRNATPAIIAIPGPPPSPGGHVVRFL